MEKEKFKLRKIVRTVEEYFAEGNCPHCKKKVQLMLMKPGSKELCEIRDCPECGRHIHFVEGRAYTAENCPAAQA